MTYSFNLIDQPWIPCITLDGELVEVSLYDFFAEAHQLREICCETPIMNAAILPMVLAILHRVFGPEDDDAWKDLWEQRAFPMESLEAYFETWYERFDLFHPERPFYQGKDDRVKPKSIIHLVHSIGNTGTLFTHLSEDIGSKLSPSDATKHLITAQYFRTAGLSGLDEKFTDSPFTRGVIFWANGSSVFETLVLNLIAYPDDHIMKCTNDDKPIWEMDDPFAKRSIPNGYLDYLTWASNRVLLNPESTVDGTFIQSMTVAPGLIMSAEVKSPQKRYFKREKKDEVSWSFMYFNSEKALWQNYHSILMLDHEDSKPPAIIEWLATLTRYRILNDKQQLRLMAIGMLADQAKPIFYRQELMPLPTALLQDKYIVQFISEAVTYAEDIADVLRNALNELAEHVLLRGADGKPDTKNRQDLVRQWNALSLYWTDLEPHFWSFIADLTSGLDDAPEQWQATLKTTAFDSLDHAIQMAGDSPWAMKGGIIARRKLQAGFNNVFKAKE